MYNWEEGPYVDELELWEDKIEEEYAEFIEKTCKCSEECECISLEKFIDQKIEEIGDRYDADDVREYQEMYG